MFLTPTATIPVMYTNDCEDTGELMRMNWQPSGKFYEKSSERKPYRAANYFQQPTLPLDNNIWDVPPPLTPTKEWNTTTISTDATLFTPQQSFQASPFYSSPHYNQQTPPTSIPIPENGVKKYISLDDC